MIWNELNERKYLNPASHNFYDLYTPIPRISRIQIFPIHWVHWFRRLSWTQISMKTLSRPRRRMKEGKVCKISWKVKAAAPPRKPSCRGGKSASYPTLTLPGRSRRRRRRRRHMCPDGNFFVDDEVDDWNVQVLTCAERFWNIIPIWCFELVFPSHIFMYHTVKIWLTFFMI